MDEIDELVAQVQGDEEDLDLEDRAAVEADMGIDSDADLDADGSGEEEPQTKPKRRRSRAKPENGGVAKTMEELESFEFLGGRLLPKPSENVKTLGDMYAKYSVGNDPDFKVQVFRTYPKMYRGKKFDGFYDTWDIPMSMEQIQAEYGGGQYRIVVVGPHPSDPRMTTKHYDSVGLAIAGEPKWDSVPRALQGTEVPSSTAQGQPGYQMPAPMAQESPKLAEVALKMMQSTAESERDERRRVEDRSEARRQVDAGGMAPIIEAERRRSDDVIRAERERSQSERTMMVERLDEERRERNELRRKMESMGENRRTIGEEIASLATAGILKSGDDGSVKEMLTQILEKHRGEMASVQASHTTFIESLRQGHASEIAAVRDAHRSEVAASNEASRSREGRIDERLQAERAERVRDQDRHREQIEQRDLQWKDRMEQAQTTLQSSWDSRHQSLISTYENRVLWLQQEIDRLKLENSEQRGKQEEKGDVITQLAKMKEMQDIIRGIAGSESGSSQQSSSGGIGLSGGDDWKATLVEGLGDRLPAILTALTGGGAPQAAPPPPPPQYQEGQIVETPNGTMVVVRDPGGQLAFAPKAAFDAHQEAVASRQTHGGALPSGSSSEQRRRRQPVSAVQNFSDGLPKRRPPWEGGGERAERGAAPPPPPPPQPPRMTTRVKEEPVRAEPMELSNIERQAIKLIAKEVHNAVMGADDPEEFVAKMMSAWDPTVLKQVVSGYTTAQIAQGVAQVEPGGAGATPGGQQFIREAFALLREALR